MYKLKIIFIVLLTFAYISSYTQNSFNIEELQQDFHQFRNILENEHCCTYEYTSKTVMDSLFDSHFQKIDHEMERNEFFRLLAPISAKIGCMHTAAWMPGRILWMLHL